MSPERRGRLVLVVGPSGAGKDTLINLARECLAGDENVLFVRRVVTRAAGGVEDHDCLSPEAFEAAEAAGAFALSWRAHGLGYGIPASAADAVAAGRCVVCNASRGIVAEARARFPRVEVVQVSAPAEVLAERLAARGRESAEDVAARVRRAELRRASSPSLPPPAQHLPGAISVPFERAR